MGAAELARKVRRLPGEGSPIMRLTTKTAHLVRHELTSRPRLADALIHLDGPDLAGVWVNGRRCPCGYDLDEVDDEKINEAHIGVTLVNRATDTLVTATVLSEEAA